MGDALTRAVTLILDRSETDRMQELASNYIYVCLGVAFFFAALGGWVAEQKKRAWSEGAFLGFLFGPFGCLIEGLLPVPADASDHANRHRANQDYR